MTIPSGNTPGRCPGSVSISAGRDHGLEQVARLAKHATARQVRRVKDVEEATPNRVVHRRVINLREVSQAELVAVRVADAPSAVGRGPTRDVTSARRRPAGFASKSKDT